MSARFALPPRLMSPADNLLARSLAAVWHPCTQMKQHETLPLVPIVRGEGPWLIDAQGRRLLDGISSWWVNLFGHCNPRINAALKAQLDTLEHAMLAGFTHEPVVALSERLAALTGHRLGHAFYASDGASATEIALKMSVHYWRNQGEPSKKRFLSLAGGYHGETVGALAVTDVAIFRDAYAPLVRSGVTVPTPALTSRPTRRAASRIDTGPAAHSAFSNSQRLALNTFQSSSGEANAIRAWASPRPLFIARAASANVSARLRTSRTTVFMIPPRNVHTQTWRPAHHSRARRPQPVV